ncbi:MAG: NUDIX hydrolase [Anaerovoracaceae bacterium]
MIFEEKTVSSKVIFEGQIIKLREDQVTVVNGGTSTREIVEHNGGAGAVAITDEGKIVLVKQFRKPLDRAVIEIPAGKIEKGEDHLKNITRELQEETGYSAKSIKLLTTMHPSVGYCTELLYIYLAEGLTPGENNLDENEALDVMEVTFEEALNMINSGEITDAKTQVGILLANNIIKER